MRWLGTIRFTHGSADCTAFTGSRNRFSTHGYAAAGRGSVAYCNFGTDSHPTPDARRDWDADTHCDGITDAILHGYRDCH